MIFTFCSNTCFCMLGTFAELWIGEMHPVAPSATWLFDFCSNRKSYYCSACWAARLRIFSSVCQYSTAIATILNPPSWCYTAPLLFDLHSACQWMYYCFGVGSPQPSDSATRRNCSFGAGCWRFHRRQRGYSCSYSRYCRHQRGMNCWTAAPYWLYWVSFFMSSSSSWPCCTNLQAGFDSNLMPHSDRTSSLSNGPHSNMNFSEATYTPFSRPTY